MKFEEAAEKVKTLSQRPDNATLLQLYGLYKQGVSGDASGARPGFLDPRGRAKFDAWQSQKGVPQEKAREQYIELVKNLLKNDEQ